MDLAAERSYVAGILGALNLGETYTYVPARLVVPAFMVVPDSPHLTNGAPFGQARLHLRVVFVAASGGNEDEQTAVDTAISSAATALLGTGAGISIDGASAPYAGQAGNQSYLSADLQISFNINL